MVTAIQVNYSARGALGEHEQRRDRLESFIRAEHIDKAIEFVIKRDPYTAAHFSHSDGTNDAVWQEWGQKGTRMLTWRHDEHAYSHDEPTEISAADFKRRIKKGLRGEA